MPEPALSEDGLHYWDGRQWVSTLSFDGRSRWNGSAWIPVAVAGAPPWQEQARTVRVATSWTRPLQLAVAGWYAIQGLFAASLPFWMVGLMTPFLNQTIQRQEQLNPSAPPPPADLASTLTTTLTVTLAVVAVVVVAMAVVAIIGALMRWSWVFYAVLVLLGLGTVSLPANLVAAMLGSTAFTSLELPSWLTWSQVGLGIPGAALFVWMLVALARRGPWAMAKVPAS